MLYNSPKYLGRCPNCGSWSSFVEEVEVAEVKNARVSLTGERPNHEIGGRDSINVHRTKTEMEEFNRVLGGGLCQKSRPHRWGSRDWEINPLLQVSTQLSQVGTVLYVRGEESAQQIKLGQSVWGILTVSFTSMQKPICRA